MECQQGGGQSVWQYRQVECRQCCREMRVVGDLCAMHTLVVEALPRTQVCKPDVKHTLTMLTRPSWSMAVYSVILSKILANEEQICFFLLVSLLYALLLNNWTSISMAGYICSLNGQEEAIGAQWTFIWV